MQNIIDLLKSESLDNKYMARMELAKMFRLKTTINKLAALNAISEELPRELLPQLLKSYDGNIITCVIDHNERAQEIINLLK